MRRPTRGRWLRVQRGPTFNVCLGAAGSPQAAAPEELAAQPICERSERQDLPEAYDPIGRRLLRSLRQIPFGESQP